MLLRCGNFSKQVETQRSHVVLTQDEWVGAQNREAACRLCSGVAIRSTAHQGRSDQSLSAAPSRSDPQRPPRARLALGLCPWRPLRPHSGAHFTHPSPRPPAFSQPTSSPRSSPSLLPLRPTVSADLPRPLRDGCEDGPMAAGGHPSRADAGALRTGGAAGRRAAGARAGACAAAPSSLRSAAASQRCSADSWK